MHICVDLISKLLGNKKALSDLSLSFCKQRLGSTCDCKGKATIAIAGHRMSIGLIKALHFSL
jgi:hypothetical protein